MNKMSVLFIKAVSTFAIVITTVDVNTLFCTGILHQPKLPKSVEKLKIK